MNLAERILKDREARHERFMEHSRGYAKPVVCGRINYPGVIKTTYEAEQAFRVLVQAMTASLNQNIELTETWRGADGVAFIMVVDDDVFVLKKNTMEIEEQHPLGRLFDIDVIDEAGKPVSRQSIKTEDRKCILCNAPALECIITRKHEVAEVIARVNDCIKVYIKNVDNRSIKTN